ncbi:MAG: hypothetical protein JSV56_09715 [Methanomassiliicoccales archaeon]|nr:MAG: hypothetical protein JSV56_09715 [Methanomassiliicoccales archaeon]
MSHRKLLITECVANDRRFGMPYCHFCRSQIAEGVKICTNCGQNVAQAPPPPRQENLCPTCGIPLRYIDQYQQWWCDNCRRYTKPMQRPPPPPAAVQVPYQQQPPIQKAGTSPPKKKKRRIKGDDIGALLILIAFLCMIFSVSMIPQDTIKAEELEKDYQNDSRFGTYSSDDSVTVIGTIESEEKTQDSNYEYIYYFSDGSFPIYSDQDMGNEGDTIIIKCKVKTIATSGLQSGRFDILEYEQEFNYVLGLGVFALSWIMMAIGIHLIAGEYRKKSSQPQYPQPHYSPPQYQQIPQMPPQQIMPREKNSQGLILGLLSILFFWFFGIGAVLGIEGVITSLRKRKVRAEFGTGGLILSIIGMIVGIIIGALMFRGMLMMLFGEI